MTLARVSGNLVSTQKNEYLKSQKLMLVHPVDLKGEKMGEKEIVAIDLIDSGIGDLVLLTQEGGAVRSILGHSKAPVHSIIIAIVDSINIAE